MSKESSKAMARRWREDAAGVFPWKEIFVGAILDAGSGDDVLKLPNVTAFDAPQGDLNHLSRYFKPETFDAINSSHSLEHVHNPTIVLREWLTLVKPGGYIVAEVPDVGESF